MEELILTQIGPESASLPGPIAFAKSDVSRLELASLTNLGPGRTFTRAVYGLFPLDHNGANAGKEFDVFLIRRGISLWPIGSQSDFDGGYHRRSQTPSRPGPSTDVTTATKRQFEGQGSSHYSPPAQRRRPLMSSRDFTFGEGRSRPVSQILDYGDDTKLPLRTVPTGLEPPGTSGPADTDLFAPSRRPSFHGVPMPAIISAEEAAAAAAKQASAQALSAATSSAAAPAADKAAIDKENVNDIIKQFTRDLTERQKEVVTLTKRVTELETNLKERDVEIAALKAGADGEKMERFMEEKQAFVRDQNKHALDRAKFAAQVSNWAEKLGQVQQGLSQHLPSRSFQAEGEGPKEGA